VSISAPQAQKSPTDIGAVKYDLTKDDKEFGPANRILRMKDSIITSSISMGHRFQIQEVCTSTAPAAGQRN